MKRKFVLFFLTSVMAVSNVVGCFCAETAKAEKTVEATAEEENQYDYDRNYFRDDCQFFYKTDGSGSIYVGEDSVSIFDKTGKLKKTIKINLNGEPCKFYYYQNNYHYFLTGTMLGTTINYKLHKFDEFGNKKSCNILIEEKPGDTYCDPFYNKNVVYSSKGNLLNIGVIPGCLKELKSDGTRNEGVTAGKHIELKFDLASLTAYTSDEKHNEKIELGTYLKAEPSYRYLKSDYHIKNYGVDSDRINYYWPDLNGLLKTYYDNKTNLLLGDIIRFGESFIITGKDFTADNKEFKNAVVAYFGSTSRSKDKTFLTNYKKEDNVQVSTPYTLLDKDGDNNKCVVAWYETANGKTVLKYGKINATGKIPGGIKTISNADLVMTRPIYRKDTFYYVVNTKDGLAVKSFKIG